MCTFPVGRFFVVSLESKRSRLHGSFAKALARRRASARAPDRFRRLLGELLEERCVLAAELLAEVL
jgi:hypothetical protein